MVSSSILQYDRRQRWQCFRDMALVYDGSNCKAKIAASLARKKEETFWSNLEKNLLEYQLHLQHQQGKQLHNRIKERGQLLKIRRQNQRRLDAIFANDTKTENADKCVLRASWTFAKNIRKLYVINVIIPKTHNSSCEMSWTVNLVAFSESKW